MTGIELVFAPRWDFQISLGSHVNAHYNSSYDRVKFV